jgi:NAD(P)-dependent dehydrogenase (short-subunit alcohol dehydrogenase family)
MMKSIIELSDMTGRVALVTGAAGHIGRAIVETVAELGADLILLDLDKNGLQAVAEQITRKYNAKVELVELDLADAAAINKIPTYIENSFSQLDILINNAAFVGSSGISGWVTRFEDQSVSTWKKAMDVNLTSAFALSQACVEFLKSSRQGVIINIASIYGVYGPDLSLYEGTEMGNPAAYAVSKGGLLQLTRWLATVLAPDIRVNALSPGGVFRNQPAKFCKRYIARTPLGRMANEEDFKGAIAFLASDMSGYMTGQNIMVDGGWGCW